MKNKFILFSVFCLLIMLLAFSARAEASDFDVTTWKSEKADDFFAAKNKNIDDEVNIGKATVFVQCALGRGTGLLIDPGGYILTNKHVANSEECSVGFSSIGVYSLLLKKTVKVNRVAISENYDLALLKITDVNKQSAYNYVDLTKSFDQPRYNMNGTYYGFPIREENELEYGVVEEKSNGPVIYYNGNDLMSVELPNAGPGSSGSGVFANNGQYLGTLYAGSEMFTNDAEASVISSIVVKKFILEAINKEELKDSIYNQANLKLNNSNVIINNGQKATSSLTIKDGKLIKIDNKFALKYAGKFLIQKSNNTLWYVDIKSKKRYLIKNTISIYGILKYFSKSIDEIDINKIEVGTIEK